MTRNTFVSSLIVSGFCLSASGSAVDSTMTRDRTDVVRREALNSYRNLPLSFIPNAGQADERVRYYAHESGHRFAFTPEEAVFSFIEPVSTGRGRGASDGEKRTGLTLALRFLGANPNVVVEGHRPAAGRVNYFIGADPAGWRTGLPTYEGVRYRELWPGVDAVFHGASGRIKYEFHVAAGVPVDRIRLAYLGAQGLSLDRQGNLLIETPLGVLTDQRPVSFQLIEGKRVDVESRYELRGGATGEKRYGFALTGYDRRYPIVIDPGLDYSTYVGDVGTALAIAVDASGSAYITGRGGVVAKLNPTGSALIYSTYLGGVGDFHGIAVDVSGNAYVTGEVHTSSTDFATTVGAFDTTLDGGWDAFVTKLNADGSALLYSTYLGGVSQEAGLGIAVDASGHAYVTGLTGSTDFPTTVGSFDTDANGGSDIFVTKLNPAGSALVYSTFLGGTKTDHGLGIALDAATNAYVTGETDSANFPTTPEAFDITFNGGYRDGFITKLDAAGSTLLYSTYLGGTFEEWSRGIAVDAPGNAYVTGISYSDDFPTTRGAFDTRFSGIADAFVTKVNAAGSALLYSTYLGEATDSKAIVVDDSGNASVTGDNGYAGYGTLPTTRDAFDTTFNGVVDAFVTKLNAAGSALLYSSYLGGASSDRGLSIAIDAWNNIYVTGLTVSNDFPTTAGAFDTSRNGLVYESDVFVMKIPAISSLTEGKVTGGGSIEMNGGIASFGFSVELKTGTGPVAGQLHFSNHATGETVQSVEFWTLTIDGDRATFLGACTNNGDPCDFTVTVQDGGEPGSNDMFQIEGAGIAPAGGLLRSGNIQIH